MALTGTEIEQLRDEDQVVLSGKAFKDLYQIGRATVSGPTREHYRVGRNLIQIAGSADRMSDIAALIKAVENKGKQ